MNWSSFPNAWFSCLSTLGIVTLSILISSCSTELEGEYNSSFANQSQPIVNLDGYDDVSIALDEQDSDELNLVRGAMRSFHLRTSGEANCWVGGNRDFSLSATSSLKVYRSAANCKLEIRGFSLSTSSSSTPVDVMLANTLDLGKVQSNIEFTGSSLRGRLSIVNPLQLGKGGIVRLDIVLADVSPTEIAYSYRGCDGGKAHGETEQRTRFAAGVVTSPSVCQSETQSRTCQAGIWTAWSGSFTNESCQTLCEGGRSHGETEQRVKFQSAQVTSPSVCQSEVQTRTCSFGNWTAWSGSFASDGCQLLCDGGRAHGEVEQRFRFQSGIVTFPSQCLNELQARTCSAGSWTPWSGSFVSDSCQVHCPSLSRSPVNGSSASSGSGKTCNDACKSQLREAAAYVGYPLPGSKLDDFEVAKNVYWGIRALGQQKGCDPLRNTVYY